MLLSFDARDTDSDHSKLFEYTQRGVVNIDMY